MTIPSEFHQKDFEAKVLGELDRAGHTWPPGEILENQIGAKAGAMATRSIMQATGHPWSFGPWLEDQYFWRHWQKKGRRGAPPSGFQTNLFMVAKPSFRYQSWAYVRGLGLASPCWQFQLDGPQQELLAALESLLGERAIVTYVAPAFDRRRDLYERSSNEGLLDSSSCPEPSLLQGCTRWAYNNADVGVALPGGGQVHLSPLLARIKAGSRGETPADAHDLKRLIVSLREACFTTRRMAIADEVDHLVEQHPDPTTEDFVTVYLFSLLMGLRWRVI